MIGLFKLPEYYQNIFGDIAKEKMNLKIIFDGSAD